MNWLILAAVTVNIAITSTLVILVHKTVKKAEDELYDFEDATAQALELVAANLKKH